MGEYTEAAAKQAALKIHNEQGISPAPDAGLTHYAGEAMRQVALSRAADANVARAATEAGVTVQDWQAKREELRRSPTPRDF